MEDSQGVGHAYQCSLSRNCQLYASEKLDWCDRTSGCQEHTHPGTSFESNGKDINLFIDTLLRWQLWCNIYFFSFCLFDSVNLQPISSYYILFLHFFRVFQEQTIGWIWLWQLSIGIKLYAKRLLLLLHCIAFSNKYFLSVPIAFHRNSAVCQWTKNTLYSCKK